MLIAHTELLLQTINGYWVILNAEKIFLLSQKGLLKV